ncbi:hypothetical protein [Fervidobacterium thailandense]|uniref:hypothetical protein n=1 Tax=Fervidobacterium thailandense TaxID=1008305 RepID=UPI001F4D75B9|nr:hypothetical protein [Fervidobacterium thailandense]
MCEQPLESFLKDVSLLTLGSLGNLGLAFDVGRYVGNVVRSMGYYYYVIGPLDTLSQDDPDHFYRVHKSPFITAEVYEYLSQGLGSSGVIAVLDGRGKIDAGLIGALNNRKLTLPTIVEDRSKADLLVNLGFNTSFILVQDGGYTFLNGAPKILYWSSAMLDADELRRKVLSNAIIYLSPGEIQVRKTFARSGVVVFSDEPFVLELAKKVLESRSAPGRVPW